MKAEAFTITRNQYNNLLPVMRSHLLARLDRSKDLDTFSFIGTREEFKDAMSRCKYLGE
jgi:hypothetical protein